VLFVKCVQRLVDAKFNSLLDAVEKALIAGLRALEAHATRTKSMTGFEWITSISLNAT
jgi:hypothetical protein